ncbi:hypothetical protein DFH09DRAFT_1225244 [Mycena vulgaris]|nr:hypothetical protein DFH09DRAFT_1225244 [Mycena vulgaris]
MCAGDACGAAPGERVARGRGLTIREWATRRRGARCVQPLALLFLPLFHPFFPFLSSPPLPLYSLASSSPPTPILSSRPSAPASRSRSRARGAGWVHPRCSRALVRQHPSVLLRSRSCLRAPPQDAGCVVRACPGVVDTPPCPPTPASVSGDARAAAGYGAVSCSRAMSLTWVGEREHARRRRARGGCGGSNASV